MCALRKYLYICNKTNMCAWGFNISWRYCVLRFDLTILFTVYPKKYAHGFCFAVLCCGYTLTDFPISIRLTWLALWQSNDCPSANKATLMNMDKYFMWIRYERLHNHNKAKHNKTVCVFLGIYCNIFVIKKEFLPASFTPWTKSACDRWIPLAKGQSCETLIYAYLLLLSTTKLLNKQSNCLWFDTHMILLWRHCINMSVLDERWLV